MIRRRAVTSLGVAVAAAVVAALGGTATLAFDAPTEEQELFALTNQDRTSNGVHALVWNGTLGAIARDQTNSSVCGFTIRGRSQDMVDRNYFSHYLPNCANRTVFNFMQADGVGYQYAGENIGWTVGTDSTAPQLVNSAFMQSTDHRANILNPAFDQAGMGAALGTSADTCCAGSSTIFFTEDFIQSYGSRPPPPPPPPPPPRRSPPPAPPPASPSPAPAASPAPSPSPVEPSPAASPSPGYGGPPGSGVEITPARAEGQGLFEVVVDIVLRTVLGL